MARSFIRSATASRCCWRRKRSRSAPGSARALACCFRRPRRKGGSSRAEQFANPPQTLRHRARAPAATHGGACATLANFARASITTRMPTLPEPPGLKKGKRLDDLEDRSVQEDEYKPKLKEAQLRLLNFQRELSETKRSLIIIFEGPDAAGKGGAIKRVTERLDPRLLRVHSIVKPTAEEYQHHYFWRFWNKLPLHGQTVIFDRSWYGRLLVERVEGFATDKEWKRAYAEINDFERLLIDDGAIIQKFYLHISKEEQLFRFKRREADPYKHWKINDEDWRNRR